MTEESRVALIGIIVEKHDCTDQINRILHEYADYIIGRMGVPYRARHMSIISVVVDAPQEVVSALSGKIGRLPGISSKVIYGKQAPEQ